jgi:adenylate cyclase
MEWAVSGRTSAVNRMLKELRRRHVFRLAGVYFVGSWLILQVADVLLDIIGGPEGSLRVIALVLVLVFPMAMIMAWVYDLTPAGVIRTGATPDEDAPAFRWDWRWVDYAIIAALVAILVFVLADKRSGEDADLLAPAHSVAVLPFSDLSPDGDHRYFSDGLSEALMDSLSRIPGLQVASRTASFAYRDPGPAVREVARSLEVATLLEGSVRKSGDHLRISARLVDGESGRRLWSESYDASTEDVFAVQDTISRSIAEVLKIRLLGGEVLVEVPTRDQAAYEDYLRGRDQLRRDGTVAQLEQAVAHFRQALARDGEFSLALAGMCTALWEKYSITRDAELAERAIEACQDAESQVDPPAETLVALGGLYRGRGELEKSLALFSRARAAAPNDAEVHAGLGDTLRAMGDLDGAVVHQRRAVELDPAFWRHYWTLGVSLLRRGDLEEAAAQFNRAIRLQPESPYPYYSLGAVYFYQGEYLKAGDAFRESIRRSPNPQAYSNAGTNYFYAGDYVQAEEMFRQAVAMSPSDFRYRGFLAEAIDMQGTRAAAEVAEHYEAAVLKVREQLEINPAHHVGRAALAGYLARLGQTDAAEAELAALRREQGLDVDALRTMAMAHLFLGQREIAVERFAAAVAAGLPAALLTLDPRLEVLKDLPEFQALLQGNAANH